MLTETLFGRKFGGEKIKGFEGACAGSLASLIAQVVTTPLDVVRTRVMISSSAEKTGNVSELVEDDVIRSMMNIRREEGVLALFAGIGPRVVRALLSGAVQFATYEITQNAMR